MTRSYIVLTILLLLLIVALASSLRRCAFEESAAPTVGGQFAAEVAERMTPTPSPTTAEMRARVGDAPAPQAPPIFFTPTPIPPGGIDGLTLRLSRPVAFPARTVRGLAVGAEGLYVASSLPDRPAAMLYQLDRGALTVAQVWDVRQGEHVLLGGLHLSGDTLWAPLADGAATADSRGSTVIAALDPRTLAQRDGFTVDDQIAAVVQGPHGTLFGVDDQATQIYEWTVDGQEVRRRPLATGAVYYDAEMAGGALLCAGRDPNGGVIDVLDSASLTILARRRCRARAMDGSYLSEHGFGFAFDPPAAGRDDPQAVFYFLTPGERFPMLMTYVLDDMSLGEWAPLPR